MLTLAKLRRFVKIRNKSGFGSNFQFHIDANHAGFDPGELDTPRKFTLDGFTGYVWGPFSFPQGKFRLCEFGRGMHLEGEPDENQMFDLLDRKAQYIEVEKVEA